MEFKTPRLLNFHMPAEWEKQEAIWLTWPHNEETWPGKVKVVENVYVRFIGALHTGQKINLLVKDKAMEQRVKRMLQQANITLSQILFYHISTVDSWIRDYGPTFVVNRKEKKLAMVKWVFNAWGNKYDDLKEDNHAPMTLNKSLTLPMFEPGIVLEGGSIDVNGEGTVLTTEQCLLNKNRNPRLTKRQIEQYLKDFLGCSKVLWLKEGIVGDDTDGHIDDIARFVSPDTVLCAYEDDPEDGNYPMLKENYDLLQKMTDQYGKKLKIIKLPMPGVVATDRRWPASYANFYIGNSAVVVPIFGTGYDTKALDIIQKCFPDRKVVGINCRDVVEGFGTLHCLSQQMPSV